MKYEVIREIFSTCSGKSTAYLNEIETDSLDEYMKEQMEEGISTYEKNTLDNDVVIYNVLTHKMKERYTFTEI